MRQVRLLWLLLLFYGFAIATLSHKIVGKLDRGFDHGFTSGINHSFEPLFYVQSFAFLAAALGGLLTFLQLRRIHLRPTV